MNIWFISDTHLGHSNIIKYCHRPFTSVEEMDKTLIRNWNARVKKNDLVFHLGDFCFNKSSEAPKGKVFEYYRKQLNGQIIFCRGNHDKNNKNKTIIESLVIKHGGKRMYLTHNPKFAKKDFSINLCGHVHDKWQFQSLQKGSVVVNLSVENWDYKPVSINEIISELHKWKRRGK